MRRFAVFVAACLVSLSALADQPPPELVQQITGTSQLVHQGDCKVESIGVSGVPCLIFFDGAASVIWVVLFDDAQQVTRIVRAGPDGERLAWCRSDIC